MNVQLTSSKLHKTKKSLWKKQKQNLNVNSFTFQFFFPSIFLSFHCVFEFIKLSSIEFHAHMKFNKCIWIPSFRPIRDKPLWKMHRLQFIRVWGNCFCAFGKFETVKWLHFTAGKEWIQLSWPFIKMRIFQIFFRQSHFFPQFFFNFVKWKRFSGHKQIAQSYFANSTIHSRCNLYQAHCYMYNKSRINIIFCVTLFQFCSQFLEHGIIKRKKLW